MYDFHTLSFTLKTHLSPNDQEALGLIPATWKEGIAAVYGATFASTSFVCVWFHVSKLLGDFQLMGA